MVILANANPVTDGSAYDMLSRVESEVPIVLISKANDFKFNEELLKLGKYVLVCFVEYSWNWAFITSHIWGENTGLFIDAFDNNEEYLRFDDFVKNNPPILQFKRELFKPDVRDNVLPIEYPCRFEPVVASKEEFTNRAIDVFYNWGLSHEARKWLHADIWKKSSELNYAVCDSFYHFNKFIEEEGCAYKWVAINTPHYSRLPIEQVLAVQGFSKVSISMPGAGKRCFRHSEAPINSIMAMERSGLAWSYDWVDLKNCIQFNLGQEVETIDNLIAEDSLYDVYANGVENVKNYYLPNYIKNYIEPSIKKALE